MKVGILTQPLRNNYGGILQNWALQQVLLELGHDPITIDAHVWLPFKEYFFDILRWLYYKCLKRIQFERRERYKSRQTVKIFGEFVEKNILKTKPTVGYDELLIDQYGIECVVVGSDQVWRPWYNPDIEDLYLEFLKNRNIKKITYGASFGTIEWEYSPELTQKCASLVTQFQAVSVREDSAVVLCHEHLGVEAELVLDPTLLLNKEKYESLCKDVKRKDESFLAVYCLDGSEEKMAMFNRIAKKFNLKMRVFSAEKEGKLSVAEWISMFRDASMIVSDSFHGTVFSIIFQKQFYSLVNTLRGNARVTSLLQQLDLTSQIINENSTEFFTVDYSRVREKLIPLRQKSIRFLTDNLQV